MRARAALAAAALTAGLLAGAAPAHASCSQRADIRQSDPSASLAVGDSVTVAAARQLGAYGFAVDAKACRTMAQGLAVMRRRELPGLVVVALGSNAGISAAEVREAVGLVGPFGQLVFVLPRALGGGPDPDGEVLRAAQEAFPEQIGLLDWPGYSSGRDGWFASDGLHLTAAGAREFARFIAEAPGLDPGLEPPPEIEPDEPPARRPRPRRPAAPAGEPLLGALASMLGNGLAALVRPVVRLLRPLVAGAGAPPADL